MDERAAAVKRSRSVLEGYFNVLTVTVALLTLSVGSTSAKTSVALFFSRS